MIILCNQEIMKKKTTTIKIEHVEIKIKIGVLHYYEATENFHPTHCVRYSE